MSITKADSRAWQGRGAMQRCVRSAAIVTFVLATADLIFASTYWHALYAVPPSRLIQNIAAGLLGKPAFAGGENTVLLGLALQYFMMSLMVSTYYVASRRISALNRRPLFWGLLYGALLYLTMDHVVLPLSAAPKGPLVMSWILSSVVAHLLIGVTIAFGARWSAQPSNANR